MKAFFAWLANLFTSSKSTVIEKPKELKLIKFGASGELVSYAEERLKLHGYVKSGGKVGYFDKPLEDIVRAFQNNKLLLSDGVIGVKETWPALQKDPVKAQAPSGNRPVNPAYLEAKKYAGKTETDSSFNKWLSGFWPKAGLPSYKTIIGTSFAWCGLFVLAMNSEVGQKWASGAAGAKNWAKYGVAIDWKKNGIPRGAIMHLNHNSCGSGSGNHVTFADGDCTAADLAKPGATVPGFGGNQGNTVKRSNYAVKEVCAVRWPSEVPLPGPVTKSINCSGQSSEESTR